MGTEKDFRVKKGLVVESGDVTLTSGNIELASGYADIDNIRIDGNTITSQNTDGNIDLTPNGTGEVNITKVDIAAGAIDGTTVGAASASTGAFTTLSATGTSTLTTVDINGGAVDGTTVGAASASTGAFTTLAASGATTLSGAVTLGDATGDDITNTGRWVGDFVPKVDSSIDLGTSSLQFAEAHIDAGYIDAITVTGTSTLTTVDINGGAIDGTTIGASSAGAITGTTITATTSVLGTLGGNVDHSNYNSTNVDIDSGAIDGTIIGAASAAAGTFAALVGTSLSVSDGAITNVSQISLDSIAPDGTDIDIKIDNNQAAALDILQGSDSYMKFVTTTGSESIVLSPEPNSSGICKVVIGDNAAEDTMIVFDGAEIEYRLGIDDSANQFEIGVGDAHDTTPVIVMDNAGNIIQLGQDSSPSSGEVLAYDGSKWTAAASASGADGMGSGFVLEDGDGTEVTIDEDKEVKFIDGDGIDINWTDVSTGSDGDPYDLTFSLDIDGMSDIGAGLASGDLFIVDDGAGGTNRKTTVDRIATLFAGTGITASSGVISVDAAQTAGTSSMTSSTSRTITTPLLSIESSTSTKPVVQIKNTTNDQDGPSELRFVKDKGAAGAANDVAGKITFYSDDASQNNQAFGQIQTKTTAATAGSETGEIGLSVATSSSGALAEVLVITGGAAAATSTVDVKGHLIVRGTTTTENSTTVDVADININLGNGVGNDAAVDGGGVTLESSSGNKTFNWVDSTDAWTSNQHMDLITISSAAYKIGGTSVLNASTLGSGVTASSLTSVGTLTTLTVDNVIVNGTTIGHTSDTDLLTLASGIVTVAGELSATTLDIGGTNISATAAELNYNDTGSAVGTVVASKTLTVDANRDVATIRNLTSDGAVRGATLSVDAVAILDTARGASQSITGATSLMNISKTTYKAAKVLYHIKKDGTDDTDAGEILITYDGGDDTAYLTHYAEISTGSSTVGTWDATVNSGNIEVRFTPGSNGNHTYSLCTTQLIT